MKSPARASEAFFKLLVHWENTRAQKPVSVRLRSGLAGFCPSRHLPPNGFGEFRSRQRFQS